MRKLLLLLVTTVFITSGCATLKPEIDECGGFDSVAKESYCYLSKEVTSLRLATAQSLEDGAITVDQAKEAAEALSKADAKLDLVEQLILTSDEVAATQELNSVRSLLRGLK